MSQAQPHGAEQELLEEMRAIVREALESRRHVIVFELASRFRGIMASGTDGTAHVRGANEWIPIESLSRLRQLVGGRFQNLKERWTQAGFPLREHRGDRSGKPELDSNGWLELVSWIGKSGFEARLASDGDAWLFEIRELPQTSPR